MGDIESYHLKFKKSSDAKYDLVRAVFAKFYVKLLFEKGYMSL